MEGTKRIIFLIMEIVLVLCAVIRILSNQADSGDCVYLCLLMSSGLLEILRRKMQDPQF